MDGTIATAVPSTGVPTTLGCSKSFPRDKPHHLLGRVTICFAFMAQWLLASDDRHQLAVQRARLTAVAWIRWTQALRPPAWFAQNSS